MSQLPVFQRRSHDRVRQYATSILTNEHQTPPRTHLRDLIAYPDNHFRAIFDSAYFIVPEGQTAPSKSQWNSLKKKMKRHDPSVFIFKEHGVTPCTTSDATAEDELCCYVDFGYLRHLD